MDFRDKNATVKTLTSNFSNFKTNFVLSVYQQDVEEVTAQQLRDHSRYFDTTVKVFNLLYPMV